MRAFKMVINKNSHKNSIYTILSQAETFERHLCGERIGLEI